MKVKNRLYLYAAYIVIGVIIDLVAALVPMGDYKLGVFSGFGTVLILMGVIRFVQYYRIVKNPEKEREYETMQTEERTAFLSSRAKAWTFYIFIFVELAIALAALFIFDSKVIGQCFSYLAAAQGFTYFIIYKILNKKY